MKRARLDTYSPIKLVEHADLFPRTVTKSPPATNSAREAHLRCTIKPYVLETADAFLLNREIPFSGSEGICHTSTIDEYSRACEASTRRLENFFEPRPSQLISDSIAEVLAKSSDDESEGLTPLDEQTSDESFEGLAGTAAFSTGTVLTYRPEENTQRFLRDSLVLRQLVQRLPKAILQPGKEHRVSIVANGPSGVIGGFDLFASDEKHGSIQIMSTLHQFSSPNMTDQKEAVELVPEQEKSTDRSSDVLESFDYPFIPISFDTTVTGGPRMVESPQSSPKPPHRKQVAFAKARRIITYGGTTTEEDEATFEQSKHAEKDLPSKFVDLNDGWHSDDQDLIDIGKHVAAYEVPRADRRRTKATIHALICLQICLARAHTKLLEIKSLEEALELRHKSHTDAVEQVADLTRKVAGLEAREAAGKAVFDQMMSTKLIELAWKDKELEALQKLCKSPSIAQELAELHQSLRELRQSNIEYIRISEDSFRLLQRADDRQAQAEQASQTARIAQTFAEMNQQSAEEYRDNLKERILELELERDQAVTARDDAFTRLEQWQHAHTAQDPGLAESMASTTPAGTPTNYHERQKYGLAHAAEVEASESSVDVEEEQSDHMTKGITEEFEGWDDSQIF